MLSIGFGFGIPPNQKCAQKRRFNNHQPQKTQPSNKNQSPQNWPYRVKLEFSQLFLDSSPSPWLAGQSINQHLTSLHHTILSAASGFFSYLLYKVGQEPIVISRGTCFFFTPAIQLINYLLPFKGVVTSYNPTCNNCRGPSCIGWLVFLLTMNFESSVDVLVLKSTGPVFWTKKDKIVFLRSLVFGTFPFIPNEH